MNPIKIIKSRFNFSIPTPILTLVERDVERKVPRPIKSFSYAPKYQLSLGRPKNAGMKPKRIHKGLVHDGG